MSKYIYVELQFTGSPTTATPPDLFADLFWDGVDVGPYKYDGGVDANGNNQWQPVSVAGASYDRPTDYGTRITWTDGSGNSDGMSKWLLVSVPDGFAIPDSMLIGVPASTPLFGGYNETSDHHTAFSNFSAISLVTAGANKTIETVLGVYSQVYFGVANDLGQALGLPGLGDALENTQKVYNAVTGIQKDALNVLSYGIGNLSNPNFNPEDYNNRVNGLLTNSMSDLVSSYLDMNGVPINIKEALSSASLLVSYITAPDGTVTGSVTSSNSLSGPQYLPDGTSIYFAGNGISNDIGGIHAGAGTDIIYTGPENDTIYSGPGNDFVSAGAGDDRIVVGLGSPTAPAVNDFVNGGPGNDTIVIGLSTGATQYTGDISRIALPGNVIVDLSQHEMIAQNAATGAQTFTGYVQNVENVDAGPGNDQLNGDNGPNMLNGGAGNDFLYGALGADVLTGGPGADRLDGGGGWDTFLDNSAGLSGDTIVDFHPGDRIILRDQTPGVLVNDFIFNFSANTLSWSSPRFGLHGSMTVEGVISGTPKVVYEGDGVHIVDHLVENDFNGDGKSDVLWRNSSGYLTEWLGTSSGGLTDNAANAASGSVDNSWQIVGTGDFNGDGFNDILWRNSAGFLTDWLGTPDGHFFNNAANALTGAAGTNWQVVGSGDFNGDGMSDVLWRNASGYLTEWLGTLTGGFTDNAGVAATAAADNSWKIVGTGDFNGDGIADILWRNISTGYVTEWLGTASGAFTDNSATAATAAADNSWTISGIGDFNGDGRSDILWRNVNTGYATEWLGEHDGWFALNGPSNGSADNSWQVAQIGDFNGDGISDILWRNNTGFITQWLGTSTGEFTDNAANAATGAADNTWHVQEPFL